MKFFIDTADTKEIRAALELGLVDGVTTNPSLVAKTGRDFHAVLHEIAALVDGPISAEVTALDDCRARGNDPAGSTLYVTLEPCAHHGRQPPCSDAILAAGVSRVVIGSDDPSEKASGRGPGALRDEGIEVAFAEGAEAAAARLLNQPFRKHARTGLPHVTLKSALSLDGRVATAREALAQWEAVKQSEAQREGRRRSVLEGVPRSLPSLLRAQRLQAKASRIGFDWPTATAAPPR